MKIGEYILRKYKSDSVRVLTRGECQAFDIKFPLRNGWYAESCEREITPSMEGRLISCLLKQARPSSAAGLAVFGVAPTNRQEARITFLENKPAGKKQKKKKKKKSRPDSAGVAQSRQPAPAPCRVVTPPNPVMTSLFVEGVHVASNEFLGTYAWATLRMQALKLHGACCQCCGASRSNGEVMNVDHIKPRKLFPALALDIDNLQVLCGMCNKGKGNWDQTDWRPDEFDPEQLAHLRLIKNKG